MKLTTIAAAAALAVASMSASAATYVPGTYTYKVNAHNAAMTVAVTVSKHKIVKIDWSKNLETIGVGQLALEKVGGRILEKQSLGVDGVTGATISSMALKYAVGECLKQAKVSAEDLKDLKKNVEEYKALPNTMKTQVVIIGGGSSGLAAAVAASQAGADVIVLDRRLDERLRRRAQCGRPDPPAQARHRGLRCETHRPDAQGRPQRGQPRARQTPL